MSRLTLKRLPQLSVVLAALLVSMLWLQACADSSPTAGSSPTVSGPSSASGPSLTQPTTQPNIQSSESKVDTILLDLLLQYRLSGKEGALKYAQERDIIDANNNVVFTLVLTSDDTGPVTAKIQSMGGTVKSSYKDMVSVAVPLDTLTTYVTNDQARANFFQSLASFSQVKEIRFVPPPSPGDFEPANLSAARLRAALAQAGQYQPSQGVRTIGANRLQQQGVSGQNMKIGLIDVGFKDYQQFKDYLPPGFTYKDFTSYYGPNTSIHGVASAIVLHQVAPAAQILAAPVDSWDGFCNALDWLAVTNKVRVVATVIGWNGFGRDDGSGQLDGCIDQARAAGTLVVVAAGNDAFSHYGGMLNPHNGYHQFPNGTDRMRITTRGGDAVEVVLNWDDWEDRPVIDLDLYILDASGKIIASSRNVQAAGKPPWEYLKFPNKPGSTYYVQVKLNKAPRNVKLNIHVANAGAYLEFPVVAASLAVPGDAKGALTVAATEWDTDKLADYSGQGPTADGRIKPDISGPTDVVNPAYAQEESRTFSGTSAATPHVAAAALLTLQAHPEYTAAALYTALTQNAKKLGTDAPNNQTGYGRADLSFLQEKVSAGATQVPLSSRPGPVTSFKTTLPTTPAVLITTRTALSPVTTPAVSPALPTILSPEPTGVVAGLVFRDDFSSADSGLPDSLSATGIGAGYSQGSYDIEAKSSLLTWVSYPARPASDFMAQVRLTLPGPNTFGGLTFWQTSPHSYYALLVGSNAEWELARLDDDKWQVLNKWTEAATLQPSISSNALQLETQGVNVKISFNGKLVARLKTGGPPPDKAWAVGLAGGSYQNSNSNPAQITFNNFSYTALQ